MKYVQLKFDSLLNLWCFKERVQLAQAEIIASKNLLICELSDAAIELALQNYHAWIDNQTICDAFDKSFH